LARKRAAPQAVIAQWNMSNARKRLDAKGDLWAGRAWKEAKLEPALRKAQRTWGE
jgi:hypothetical protein